jgi:hypothetical protein
MTALKSPDNATLPEPIKSRGRELSRLEAREIKMVGKAQPWSARQAKERIMPSSWSRKHFLGQRCPLARRRSLSDSTVLSPASSA